MFGLYITNPAQGNCTKPSPGFSFQSRSRSSITSISKNILPVGFYKLPDAKNLLPVTINKVPVDKKILQDAVQEVPVSEKLLPDAFQEMPVAKNLLLVTKL